MYTLQLPPLPEDAPEEDKKREKASLKICREYGCELSSACWAGDLAAFRRLSLLDWPQCYIFKQDPGTSTNAKALSLFDLCFLPENNGRLLPELFKPPWNITTELYVKSGRCSALCMCNWILMEDLLSERYYIPCTAEDRANMFYWWRVSVGSDNIHMLAYIDRSTIEDSYYTVIGEQIKVADSWANSVDDDSKYKEKEYLESRLRNPGIYKSIDFISDGWKPWRQFALHRRDIALLLASNFGGNSPLGMVPVHVLIVIIRFTMLADGISCGYIF